MENTVNYYVTNEEAEEIGLSFDKKGDEYDEDQIYIEMRNKDQIIYLYLNKKEAKKFQKWFDWCMKKFDD